jgi:hypothetical protein
MLNKSSGGNDFYDAILYPEKKNKNYKISEETIRDIFYNNIEDLNKTGRSIEKRSNLKKQGFTRPYKGKELVMDRFTEYSYNSLDFRSPEFNDADLLLAGCSYTFGLGVPEECIWGVSLANELGLSYANLGKPGVSSDWIVDSVFSYLKLYKKPKFIFCLFPDFTRMRFPINPNINVSEFSYFGMPTDGQIFIVDAHFSKNQDIDLKPSYSRKPYQINDVLGIELSIFNSIKKILILEQYCKDLGIKFLWSVWEPKVYKTILKIQKDFLKYDSFVELDVESWAAKIFEADTQTVENPGGSRVSERYVPYNVFSDSNDSYNHSKVFSDSEDICHLDLKEKYPEYFYWGKDVEISEWEGHWGVHKHRHIAESFIERSKKL